MIKLEHVEVFGWEAAIRGMRNPMNSWDKSDSYWACSNNPYDESRCDTCEMLEDGFCAGHGMYRVGENDLSLMKKLAKAGNDHGKFARMINVTLDITAPLYWWKEFDTYKVGTVANSCSTMHKIHSKEFTLDDFSCEHLIDDDTTGHLASHYRQSLNDTIDCLNCARKQYLETNDKVYWWQMIQLLPSSYNQKRTVQLNYQVLWSMYQRRKDHKLDCWRDFCQWIETLPHFKEIYLEE